MPENDSTTKDSKNRAERRAEEREKARDAQIERDTETLVDTLPSPVTAVDGLGVERIITTVDGTYKTAQTDPDPKEVERLANLGKKLDAKKAERLDAMGATPEAGGEVAKKALEAEQKSPSAGTTKPAGKSS